MVEHFFMSAKGIASWTTTSWHHEPLVFQCGVAKAVLLRAEEGSRVVMHARIVEDSVVMSATRPTCDTVLNLLLVIIPHECSQRVATVLATAVWGINTLWLKCQREQHPINKANTIGKAMIGLNP